MPFMNTQIDIGIIQREGDSRNILAAITESVDKTFQACKKANPRGFMDQADAQCEDWIIAAGTELGGRLKQLSPELIVFDFTG